MTDGRPGLTIGTLQVRGASGGGVRETGAEFGRLVGGLADTIVPAARGSSLLKLEVVREQSETAAEAAVRALRGHFAEAHRGR
jgi:hypothetical protein